MTQVNAAHVLIATDLSDNANAALQVGADLALRMQARVTLLHCINPTAYVPPMVSVTRAVELEHAIEKDLREATDTTLQGLQARYLGGCPDVKVETLVSPQTAAAICEYAAAHGVDWLVVASHGHSFLRQMLIGSVAERVVRHAPCTVVVAR